MKQKLIGVISLAAVLGLLMIFYPEGAGAAIAVAVTSAAAIYLFRSYSEEKRFLTGLFLGALALRLALGIFLEALDLRSFFGNDATLYDRVGALLVDYWTGSMGWEEGGDALQRWTSITTAGWGMFYLTGTLYLIFGKNVLAAQSFCAVVGAATPGLVYLVSNRLFRNKRVGKTAAVLVAVFPAFIVWSSQLLKDGLIVFLLVLSILLVLRLQERFSIGSVILLILALFGILSLRFYIFYMVAVSVAGSFIIGTSGTKQNILVRTAALLLIGVGLTYFGVSRSAEYDLGYTDLERIQRSRADLATSAESGYGEDIDVSTTSGALLALPIGFVYLMFAPFPWQVTNLRQAITLPEIFVWWLTFPFMLMGVWYAIKHRLRDTLPVLIFSLMLTIAYSIFQGNVGTAYRQRTQIQVFLFMFIAVGWVLWQERREDKKMLAQSRRRRVIPGIGEDVRGVS